MKPEYDFSDGVRGKYYGMVTCVRLVTRRSSAPITMI